MSQNGPAGTDRDRASILYLLVAGSVAGGVLLGVWIALVGQADLQDNIAGLIAVGTALVFAWLVSVRGRAVPQFRRADLVRIAAFAPQTITQTAGVYVATWRRVRGRGQPGGFRTVTTEVGGGGGWRSARRSGVVAALLSFTPDTIVIDIDAETGVATVHDFVATTGLGGG
jgi:multisubunit Na+/H+ antiporter MnhE subunit